MIVITFNNEDLLASKNAVKKKPNPFGRTDLVFLGFIDYK